MSASRLRVLIVDDEPHARRHVRSLLEERDDVEVVGECGDGESAIAAITEQHPDLVLLDVQMPGCDGLAVARQVGAERMPHTIFITAYDEYALAAFDVHAIDYMLKPVNRQRFSRAIDRVVKLRDKRATADPAMADLLESLRAPRAGSDRLAVRVGERMIFLRVNDIDWIEASGDSARIHVGRQIYDHRITLSQLEQRLPRERFVRIHRSAIVNVERIAEFQPWFQGDWIVVLADGTRVQSGKSYRARMRSLIEG